MSETPTTTPTITALRILPPFAIARVGSGAPLDSYRVEVDEERPLDFRTIVPDTTFVVDERTGAITSSFVPDDITFRDDAGDGTFRIRKVAPFLELWAVVESPAGEQLVPVTLSLLDQHGWAPEDLRWTVEVANRKVQRRTGRDADAVTAHVSEISDHGSHLLIGTSASFVPGGTIPFGSVRYLRPTDEFPEIRFRFTPADGLIYGSDVDEQDPGLREWENTHLAGRPYAVAKSAVKHRTKDTWYHWWIPVDDEGSEEPGRDGHFQDETLPPSLFAIVPPAPPWLHDNVAVSRGYFDDACDGIVEVTLGDLTAAARITAGPPALVPDALFVRSLADDLEQVIEGPEVDPLEPPDVTLARAEEIVRRAFETVRFMNVAVMNGEPVQGRPPLSLDTMPAEEAFDTDRLMRPVMAEGTVDTLSVMALHQQVYAALRGGAAPWFVRLLRSPLATGDFTDDGRRRMPALMCGADGNYLALTHRQIDTIAKVSRDADTRPPTGSVAALLTPRNRTAQMHHVAVGSPFSSSPAAAIANCCPGLEVDFRAVWRRVLEGITLREYDNLVLDVDPEVTPIDLRGHRLVAVGGVPTISRMLSPSPADLAAGVVLRSNENPDGVVSLEWSNAFARMLSTQQGTTVLCTFTRDAVWEDQLWWDPEDDPNPNGPDAALQVTLKVRPFFDGDTAFISRALAEPGELTQGLCSPWQNDFRECSCYYWASARPDFVNVETTADGRSEGDNWLQKERTGTYVPDDYLDDRLVLYDDLMGEWERWLRFQVGGRDADSSRADP